MDDHTDKKDTTKTRQSHKRAGYSKPARSHELSKQFNFKLLSPSDLDSKAKRISAFDSIFKHEELVGGHFERKAHIQESRREKHEKLMEQLTTDGIDIPSPRADETKN